MDYTSRYCRNTIASTKDSETTEGSRETTEGSRETTEGSRETTEGSRETTEGSRETTGWSNKMNEASEMNETRLALYKIEHDQRQKEAEKWNKSYFVDDNIIVTPSASSLSCGNLRELTHPSSKKPLSSSDIFLQIHDKAIEEQKLYATDVCRENIHNENYIFGYIEDPKFAQYINWNIQVAGNFAYIFYYCNFRDRDTTKYIKMKCKKLLDGYQEYREQELNSKCIIS